MKRRICAAAICCMLLLTGCGSGSPEASVPFDEFYADAIREAEAVIANGSADESELPEAESAEEDTADLFAEPDSVQNSSTGTEESSAPETTAAPKPAQTTQTVQTSAAPEDSETTAADPEMQEPPEDIPVPDPGYETNGSEAAVTGYDGLKAAPAAPLTVPAELNGLPVTAVAKYGFYTARYAANVVLPETVREIRAYAFNGSALTQFSFVPAEAVTVGNHAFSDCAALETVSLADRAYTCGDDCFAHSGIVTFTAEGTALTLGDDCFRSLDRLETVAFRGTLTTGDSCFRKCEALSAVTLTGSQLALGASTFRSSGVRTVTVTDCTGTLGAECFADCERLRQVQLGEGITALGRYAFAGCRVLRTVQLPASLTEIAEGCFSDCRELTIYAPAGSAAYQYAERNGIPVKAAG